jgi:hypothetical protein
VHLDKYTATVAFLSSVLSPREKGVVLWGAVISQGQQWTNSHCVRPCVRVSLCVSPADRGIVWHVLEFVVSRGHRMVNEKLGREVEFIFL